MGINRRRFLEAAAVFGWAAGTGCVPGRRAMSRFVPGPDAGRGLARVLVSRDRVIRTVTGLRPYRPSGFVVRAEPRDGKLLIHNYGHGGAGVTLSWGTAHLAAEHALQTGASSAAVLGCGAVGLATARLLQRRGWRVTIYARELPPETTSNVAGAQWLPFSVFSGDRITSEFETQYLRACRLAHQEFQLLVGPVYGVRWLDTYLLHHRPAESTGLARQLDELFPGTRELAPGEHPFDSPFVRRSMAMLIEPPIYLAAMLRDFLTAGGRLVVREIREQPELLTLPEPVIVNCTGLGSRSLFQDEELTPVKGQLSFLPPQPEVDYILMTDAFLYMYPRQDGILLGGTYEPGVWDLAPDPKQTERILSGHARLFAAA